MSGSAHRFIGFPIQRPTLLLDEARAKRNIARMVEKARRAGVHLRPHFKTHQSVEIGAWFKAMGVESITVSSVEMAEAFAEAGWTDITIAFPVNLPQLDSIRTLASEIDLGLLVDAEASAIALSEIPSSGLNVWIKIDAGYGRAGVPWDDTEKIAVIAGILRRSPKTHFEGILTHSGHSYHQRSRDGVLAIHTESANRMKSVKTALLERGHTGCKISIGDTPTSVLADDFSGIDEIRPGNFVFYDLMQRAIGSCGDDEIAVAVACPVVGKYRHRRQILIYGGAVHLSKEHLLVDNEQDIFGCLSLIPAESLGSPDWRAPLVSLSQEHGLVEVTEEIFNDLSIGDVVLVLPVHSCLTCDLHREYWTLGGARISRI